VTRLALILAATAALAPRPAAAQGAAPSQPDVGYIGRGVTPLEVDDCKPIDVAEGEAQQQGFEHYDRGETLYAQGDYEGAVLELVYAYCLVPSYYMLLKDIGQAYERNLDYEKAIGYLERFVREVPPGATAKPPAVDPQQDKANVARRVEVLKKLKAKLYVESQPAGARITIANDAGVAARARSGETIEVLGGHYEMVTEHDGYEPHRQSIDVRIGKPYTYFVQLVALKGRLSMQVVPPSARIFLGDRFLGLGHIDVELPGATYVVTSEAPDHITDRREIVVLANQVKRVQVELTAQRQFGRRQLILFATGAGGVATAGLLSGFENTGLVGFVAGSAAGLLGSSFLLPRDLPLGASNLTVTATIGGAILGAGGTLVFTSRGQVIQPVMGATAAVGGAVGYLIGSRTRISTGDAALINSGIVWGSATGGLFVVAFDPGRAVAGGLVLSGLGMGTVGGILLQKTYGVTRTHAALIDVGGVIGILGGLAAESLIYPTSSSSSSDSDDRAREHLANFALGGMAIGLIAAGVVTRNFDGPVIPISPSVTTTTADDPRAPRTTIYGITGRW
jgi:hypothetical protein